MYDYVPNPLNIRATQWNGTRSDMYRVASELIALGLDVTVHDNFVRGGTNVLEIGKGDEKLHLFALDYIVSEGAEWRIVKKDIFEHHFRRAVPDGSVHGTTEEDQG